MKLILASKSPRRKELLTDLGYSFEIRTKDTDESYPSTLESSEVALFIARLKSKDLEETIQENEILLTADTIVVCGNKILGKPSSEQDAFEMISLLSGKTHQVITAVCLTTKTRTEELSVVTNVTFKDLSANEINHYITHFKPLDKAGAYGIQEWIGLIGVSKIEGSYSNVVGLPTMELNKLLVSFQID